VVEKDVRSPQRDEGESVCGKVEQTGVLEVFPEVADRLDAFRIRGTDSKRPLDLAEKPSLLTTSRLADQQKIVCIQAQVFGLEMNLCRCAIEEDGWYRSDQKQRQQVCVNVLFEDVPSAACGGRAGNRCRAI
jgi:hypothetical protein